MTLNRAALLLPLCLAAATGCGSSPAEPGAGATAALVVDRDAVAMPSDAADIIGARIERGVLLLSLSHGGGCREHRFALHLVLPVPPGDTPILELTLAHDAHGDPCGALLEPVVRVSLEPLRDVIAPRRSATLRLYRPGAAAPSAALPYRF